MLARIAFGLELMMSCIVYTGSAGGKDTLAAGEVFRHGDTLRFTTDGTVPDRRSRFVVFGANGILVTKTTTFNARLYRPGFEPTSVQSHTVYVRDSVQRAGTALKR